MIQNRVVDVIGNFFIYKFPYNVLFRFPLVFKPLGLNIFDFYTLEIRYEVLVPIIF